MHLYILTLIVSLAGLLFFWVMYILSTIGTKVLCPELVSHEYMIDQVVKRTCIQPKYYQGSGKKSKVLAVMFDNKCHYIVSYKGVNYCRNQVLMKRIK